MIFWIGFTLMVLNEGFVIMRHVHPWFATQREALMAKLGTKWKIVHGLADTLWIALVAIGFAVNLSNWPVYVIALQIFWGSALFFVYVPKLIKLILKAND
tara:strand:- start:382 stop:681 length:300 start_codon:yes stop_codon:yes gene_type:complete